MLCVTHLCNPDETFAPLRQGKPLHMITEQEGRLIEAGKITTEEIGIIYSHVMRKLQNRNMAYLLRVLADKPFKIDFINTLLTEAGFGGRKDEIHLLLRDNIMTRMDWELVTMLKSRPHPGRQRHQGGGLRSQLGPICRYGRVCQRTGPEWPFSQ